MVAYSYYSLSYEKLTKGFFVHFCWGIMTLSSEFTKCNVTYPVNPFISLIIAHQRIHKRKYCILGFASFQILVISITGIIKLPTQTMH